MQFPKDFLWGAATASYQIEGAAREDGRGTSIWDRFCQTPGKVAGGDTGDVACDHYHRYAEDVDLMAQMGLKSYRFSIAWPRIYPTGEGRLNDRGLDFYKRLVDQLLSKGIMPVATLYHWDLPQELQYRGGWANREVAEHFAAFARTMYAALGDRVPMWSTVNEPFCPAYLGCGNGMHAPGYQDQPMAIRAAHHLLLAHGLAVDAYRALGLKGQVGITLNMSGTEAASESEEDRWAARRYDQWHHGWFFDPLFKGTYPAELKAFYEQVEPMSYVLPGDMAQISRPIDFLGVNFYTRAVLRKGAATGWLGGVEVLPATAPVTDQGWEIVPEHLHRLLTRIGREWTKIPLYIHENGCATPDVPEVVEGAVRVEDPARIAYIRDHLRQGLQAIEGGANLKGWYVWSLLDNFEWAWGYAKRFGMIYVDYATQRRIPKASYFWYRDVIARNGL
jgi:beta-glucosidase